ncbi:unnamed protein product, partial [Closterium sp. Naga37s-1]
MGGTRRTLEQDPPVGGTEGGVGDKSEHGKGEEGRRKNKADVTSIPPSVLIFWRYATKSEVTAKLPCK